MSAGADRPKFLGAHFTEHNRPARGGSPLCRCGGLQGAAARRMPSSSPILLRCMTAAMTASGTGPVAAFCRPDHPACKGRGAAHVTGNGDTTWQSAVVIGNSERLPYDGPSLGTAPQRMAPCGECANG